MERRTKRWLGALAAVTAGAVGTTLFLRNRRSELKRVSVYPEYRRREGDSWARPGMAVTFRAELMPGRERSERTFRVARLLPSGRVELVNFAGEHSETEFEPPRW